MKLVKWISGHKNLSLSSYHNVNGINFSNTYENCLKFLLLSRDRNFFTLLALLLQSFITQRSQMLKVASLDCRHVDEGGKRVIGRRSRKEVTSFRSSNFKGLKNA